MISKHKKSGMQKIEKILGNVVSLYYDSLKKVRLSYEHKLKAIFD